MTPAEGKAVWLLGSGFSAPLGGPLLSDLFRQETKEEIVPFFPEKEYPDLAESLPWVQRIFHFGKDKALWKNAEAFLAYVDDAYRGSATAKRRRIDALNRDVHAGVSLNAATSGRHHEFQEYQGRIGANLDRIVKRALASEVSRFLIQSPPASEPWLPYRNWIKSLRPGMDRIVTFNYDNVIERAAKAAGAESKIWFGVPGPRSPKDKVPVLKLHGSVGWRLKPDPNNEKRLAVDADTGDEDLLRSPTEEIAIAPPGGTKSDYVSDYFESLWVNAESALTDASILFVVGYSFPDTDPTAQYRLLDAFAAGASIKEKAAHIVLGSEVTPASRRMLSLIRSTARDRMVRVSEGAEWIDARAASTLNIVQHPLGTQDFIGRHAAYTSPVQKI